MAKRSLLSERPSYVLLISEWEFFDRYLVREIKPFDVT